MVVRNDVEKGHESVIIPNKEVVASATKRVLDKHRETLERLAKN